MFILLHAVHYTELGIMHFQGNEKIIGCVISERCVQLVHAQIMKAEVNIWKASDSNKKKDLAMANTNSAEFYWSFPKRR